MSTLLVNLPSGTSQGISARLLSSPGRHAGWRCAGSVLASSVAVPDNPEVWYPP